LQAHPLSHVINIDNYATPLSLYELYDLIVVSFLRKWRIILQYFSSLMMI